VSKFTQNERATIKSIVATLSIKKIPEVEIINEIYRQTNKLVSRRSLCNVKQQIKKDSSKWYSQLREDNNSYIHEFKERINEIADLQRRHYKIIDDNANNAPIQQLSLAALHKLNVTLSSYYDILPGHKQTGGGTEAQADKSQTGVRMSPAGHYTRMPLVENCRCILSGVHTDTIRHIECHWCMHVWCANAIEQDWCPNPECTHGIKGNEFEPWDANYKWIECSCGMWFKTQEILQAHLAAYPHSNVNNNEEA
jgi:hypothetical protein